MNRSLEALAIFTICLGGILAVVRCSTDRAKVEPAVAEQTKSAPAQNSGSAAEQAGPPNSELAYSEGCGLDRNDGQIYAPLSPLLSPREVALRAIRSRPIPLVILPEADDKLVDETGYDTAYDIAMGNAVPSPEELSRSQLEAEYAAAELAAAVEGATTGTFSMLAPSELTPPSPTWNLIWGSLSAVRSDLVNGSRHLQRSYVEPISRGVENRLQRISLPSLDHPRAKTEPHKPLILRRQAAAMSSQSVTWDNYLAFVGRKLPVETSEEPEQRVARQKSPRNVLWPR